MPSKRTTIRLSKDEFHDLNENGGGACLACGDIVESGVEPDARGYRCGHCGEPKVYGIEECVIMGRVELVAGDDE
jgi:hypothetical protein